MLKSKDLRVRAWNSLKGKYWLAFLAALVVGIIFSVGTSFSTFASESVGVVTSVEADISELDDIMKAGAAYILGMSLLFSLIGSIYTIFVGNPMMVGNYKYFIENTSTKPAFSTIFSGFKTRYGRNVGIMLLMYIKAFLWTLLLIVPGIIKSFEYAIIPYILADDPEITSKEAFKKAKAMMQGNKWRLFKLNFSFIGWILLCCLTLGIGTFFLVPYIEAANAEFYMELKNRN